MRVRKDTRLIAAPSPVRSSAGSRSQMLAGALVGVLPGGGAGGVGVGPGGGGGGGGGGPPAPTAPVGSVAGTWDQLPAGVRKRYPTPRLVWINGVGVGSPSAGGTSILRRR